MFVDHAWIVSMFIFARTFASPLAVGHSKTRPALRPAENPRQAYGFFGTMICAGQDADAEIETATGCNAEAVSGFLDSSHSRHFADEVTIQIEGGLPLQAAILGAIADVQDLLKMLRCSHSCGAQHFHP